VHPRSIDIRGERHGPTGAMSIGNRGHAPGDAAQFQRMIGRALPARLVRATLAPWTAKPSPQPFSRHR
jgi:hypothetical protein